MKTITSFLLILSCTIAWGQQVETRDHYRYEIKKTSQPIMVDGNPFDPGWASSSTIPHLMNHWPLDSGRAQSLTEVKTTYDDEFIYVLAVLHDKGNRVIQTLRRDDEDAYWKSDNFTFVLDPTNTKQNGFMFGVNAGGAQIEAQLNLRGSRTRFDENWDNKWYSEVRQYDAYWVAEFAIPFKTLRYSSNNPEWGINYIRGDAENNAYSTWTQFPLNYPGIDLNFMGTLSWDQNPKQAKGKVVLIPYIAGGTNRDFEKEGQTSYQNDKDVGIDAKIAVTGSLNLDLTVNPDFSNADVDQQVTNLSRFNVFFPERRNFFLENGDIFSNFGTWRISPFFSRRIGLNGGDQIPIKYGARLTGNVTKNTRVGLMNVQTGAFESLAAQNYSVAAVHHKVLARSVVKGIFINRQAGNSATENKHARNGGLEFAYLSNNGRFNNTIRYHKGITDKKLGDNSFYGFNGNYFSKHYRAGWTLDIVGENYITELGLNPRLENKNDATDEKIRQGFTRINPWSVYRFFPKSGKLNQHGPRTWHSVFLNSDNSLNERSHGFAYDFTFKNTSEIRLHAQVREVNLPFPTKLIGKDFIPLPVANYYFTQYWATYRTDTRKKLNATLRFQAGNFFNGKRYNTSTTLNFRVQPWGTFSVTHDFNRVELPGEFGRANLHLMRTNMNFSFSNTMFLTTAIQYNSKDGNYNFFGRFQWRYRPMSDLFLVYTDNYDNDGFGLKNRQIVFKATYWLNL